MKEIAAIAKNKRLYPYSEEDAEILADYSPTQILRLRITGAKKPRSYQQLKLYWSACAVVAENSEEIGWTTKEGVDINLRVALDFRDRKKPIVVRPDGGIQLIYRSISFANLGHADACNYFDCAFDLMAKKLGVTKDKLMKAIAER